MMAAQRATAAPPGPTPAPTCRPPSGYAASGDEIWVAAGTYRPGASGARTATFQLKNGVAVYGGFAGTETSRDARDWVANPTLLSGDLDSSGTLTAGDAYHVVTGSGTDATAVLDGFTIRGGNANGSYPDNPGGGMFNIAGSPTLTNVTFSGNSATGRRRDEQQHRQQPDADERHLQRQLGDLRRRDVQRLQQQPDADERHLQRQLGPIRRRDVQRRQQPDADERHLQRQLGDSGGGMYNHASSPTLTNVTFSGNSATTTAAGCTTNHSSPTLTNVTFSGNSAPTRRRDVQLLQQPDAHERHLQRQLGDLGRQRRRDVQLLQQSDADERHLQRQLGQLRRRDVQQLQQPDAHERHLQRQLGDIHGGGMYNYASSPTLANSILWGNTATSGGAQIYNDASTPAIAYSDIQGAFAGGSWDAGLGTDGGGNLDADPRFVDADGADNVAGTADDNLRLSAGSPASDAGSNGLVPADTADLDGDGNTTEPLPYDLDGSPRIVNGTVDMGAYESLAPTVTASRSGNNVLLTFSYVSAGITYQVWRSSSPSFAPGDGGAAELEGHLHERRRHRHLHARECYRRPERQLLLRGARVVCQRRARGFESHRGFRLRVGAGVQ